ncbi:Metalloprotease [Cristinia sonorae]|uniref:Metalloprotease n=1 Tax=Cristinia sonorae TaxID=1940300 RepID=A0A8K0UWQ0_9AGAR|nr:Metalloprotease [Cristinia sonorae]
MADSRIARPSTDEESAPLLQDVSHPDAPSQQPSNESFAERVSKIVQEPLSPLSKVLCVLALIFLLLSSVFIGLFAGAQHKLNSRNGEPKPVETVTVTLSTGIVTATSTVTTTYSVPIPSPTGVPREEPCLSPECITLSSAVLASLDESQDPCNNFFDFANGGWLKQHLIPSDKSSIGSFTVLVEENRRLIQQILSQESSSISAMSQGTDRYDEQLLKKLRGLYNSCMNEDLLDARGATPLVRVVKKVRDLFNGETTIVDISSDKLQKRDGDDKDDRSGLTAAVAYLHSRGIGALFEANIEGDVGRDPNFMTFYFGQPNLGLPAKEYYEEEEVTGAYRSVLERLLLTLHEEETTESETEAASPKLVIHEERLRVWPPWPWPPWDGDDGDKDGDHDDDKPVNRTEEAHKLAKRIVKFEKKIAAASLDLTVLYGDPIATYNPVPLSNLTASFPEFDFPAYFSTFAPRKFPETVILTSTTFPAALSEIISDTPRSTIQAYLETRAALALAPNLGVNTEAWRAVRSLEELLRGIKPGAVGDRAEFCITKVESTLGFAAGRYFVQETFGGESKEKGTKVITDTVSAFKESLKNLKWMDDESRAAATQKADALRVKVGYPLSPDTRNPRSLVNYYRLVKVHEDTFFENVLSSQVNDQIRMWSKLGKRRDQDDWLLVPTKVEAYYNPPANELVFPAGILRPPFFSQHWPSYISYGAFGAAASHELTHAFDSVGRLYNQEGKLEKWWTNSTSEGFKRIEKCIVEQYASYYVEDGRGGNVYVNGNLTASENIGDSGIIQAYRAWKANYHESALAGNEFLLPGLNYTREQLFFISFARIWALNIRPASAVERIRSDPHSPHRFRVEGTLFNTPEFAKAFNCPAGAKLNPPNEKRCLFW